MNLQHLAVTPDSHPSLPDAHSTCPCLGNSCNLTDRHLHVTNDRVDMPQPLTSINTPVTLEPLRYNTH